MTLRQLEHFVSAADTGTFSEAGRKFDVTQSAISLAMTELERVLDVQLFVRRKAKGPSLTAARRELLVDARRLVLHSRDFQSSARSVRRSVSGLRTVGCFPPSAVRHRVRVAGLAAPHAQLTLDLVEDSVDGLQQQLLDGRCEVAIMYDIGISADMHTTALYAVQLPSTRLVVRISFLRTTNY